MKQARIVSFFLCFAVMFTSFTGCGKKDKEIALITDFTQVSESETYQAVLKGIESFSKETKTQHEVYIPKARTEEEFKKSIIQSVENGAKIVFCIGYLFEPVIYWAQTEYPDVKFALMDGKPKDADGKVSYMANSVSFSFSQLEAGFLAGYLAVIEGNRRLGFMGGLPTPETIQFGYGFVQGAESAAEDLKLEYNQVSVFYTYFQNFEPTLAKEEMTKEWYEKYKVDLIFAPCKNAAESVLLEAEEAQKAVILAEQFAENNSKSVVASVDYDITLAVELLLNLYHQNKLIYGQHYLFDAEANGVMLQYNEKQMKQFKQENYDVAKKRLAAGSPTLLDETNVKDVLHLDLPYVKVQVVA